ncbi:hypothetical protein Nmel_003961 [Mimus melanotis]
MLESP